jgi:hypothetical protein
MVAGRILSFLQSIRFESRLPKGFEVMNPYQDEYTFGLCQQFYTQYYADHLPRKLMVGINPGRFGSGVTGVSFTDPVKLETICHIPNRLDKKAELSADFIYQMIAAFGGPESFYQQFFISALSPLGFLKDGKNINYYDDPRLQKVATPFIVKSITQMIKIGVDQQKVYCIGEGKNFHFLTHLNQKYRWFEDIIALPHPRFIMQYKRKSVGKYIDLYLKLLVEASTLPDKS